MSDNHFNGLSNVVFAVFNNNHRSVIKITNALIRFFAIADDTYPNHFTSHDNWANCICEHVDVENGYTLKFSDLIQVEVVRNNFRLDLPSEMNQLCINFCDLGEIVLGHLNIDVRIPLQIFQNLEPTSALVSAKRVRRISDMLQLIQYKSRNHNDSINKTCVADVTYSSINNNTRV